MADKLSSLRKELRSFSDGRQAEILQKFFKTGEGEYGEGDIFLGIKVPIQRKICKNYLDLNLSEIALLLASNIHEERFCACIILVDQYSKGGDVQKRVVFDFYIKNADKFNNWDLVDLSCYKIVGDFLLDKEKDVLYDFAISDSLWKKRISVISTIGFIKKGRLDDSIKICEILIYDSHDLINKAVGWVLREVGKKDLSLEKKFLNKYYKTMPRVALRYSIEKMSKKEKGFYMNRQ